MAADSYSSQSSKSFRLLQEIYYPNVWRIFVCCIMLNLTTGKQVHTVIKEMFKRYPNPKRMSEANQLELEEMIRSCGLAPKRARTLIRMSHEYRMKKWTKPTDLHGIGQYAQDSYDIFIRGKKSVRPKDKVLKQYLKQKKK